MCVALPKFKETDLEYLEEFIECVSPIAISLDRLQGDKNCFYGELLPILMQMRRTLQKLKLRHLKYCTSLVSVRLRSLEKRFNDYYSFSSQRNDAILASVSHPFFKLRWVPKEKRNDVKDLLFNEAESLCSHETVKDTESSLSKTSSETFFSFEEGTSSDESTLNVSTKNTVQLECLQYLQNNDGSLESLKNFPVIRKLFMKYNTPLPSSAPVERLFSYGSMIMRPRRRKMNDDTFEKQLLLRANSTFIE